MHKGPRRTRARQDTELLLDLKKGVEMRPFEDLPNVQVIKTEKDAVTVLKNLKAEMDRRFNYLEKKKVEE